MNKLLKCGIQMLKIDLSNYHIIISMLTLADFLRQSETLNLSTIEHQIQTAPSKKRDEVRYQS